MLRSSFPGRTLLGPLFFRREALHVVSPSGAKDLLSSRFLELGQWCGLLEFQFELSILGSELLTFSHAHKSSAPGRPRTN
jgi:hypothetical protein